MRRTYLALCALSMLAAAPARGEELGRLFLTPEQREALDARRRARLPDRPVPMAAHASPATRVDGYVQRSGGRSTVWLNGQPSREDSRESPGKVSGAGGVSVRLGDEGRDVSTKVGQTIDSASGQVTDPLDGGEIRVRRASPPREARGR
jgi:hypothetical protein